MSKRIIIRDRNRPIPEPEYERERQKRNLRSQGWDVDRAVREMRKGIRETPDGEREYRSK